MIRWSTLIALVGLLAGAVVYDRVSIAPEPPAPVAAAPVETPKLNDPGRQSTVWYCPIGSSDESMLADHSVVVSNVGSTPVSAEVAVLTGNGAGPALRFEVAPLTSEVVKLSDLAMSPVAGAVVDVVGGDAVVSHEVVAAFGAPSGPCHTSLAEEWYFASGATSRGANDYIALLNPFASDIVFTATFQTETRTREPGELDRAVVPARSVLLIDVGAYVSREAVVATTIKTVQGGRLAVERLQTFNGELGPVGASLSLGVATPRSTWTFPAGRVQRGGDNFIRVFNPSDEVAQVDLELDPLDPTDRATYGLVPIELTIQPGRVLNFDLGAALETYPLPVSYELGVTAISTTGTPVVVDNWQLTPKIDTSLIGAGGDAATADDAAVEEEPVVEEEPAVDPGQAESDALLEERLSDPALAPPIQPDPTVGITSSHGVAQLATRWIIPQMQTLDGGRSVVVVSAPEGALVEVRLIVAGQVLDPVRVSVPASGRALIELAPVSSSAVVLVQSDSPIAAVGSVVNPDVDRQLVAGIPIVRNAE